MKELFKYQKKNIKCRQHFTSKMTNRLEGVAKLEELNVLELKVFEYYLLIKWKNNQLQIFGTSVILWGKNMNLVLPGCSEANIMREYCGFIDVIMPMNSINPVYERNSQSRRKGSLLKTINHIHPVFRTSLRAWHTPSTTQHTTCNNSSSDKKFPIIIIRQISLPMK